MKIFERKVKENFCGRWIEYYFLGRKIHTKLACLYRYDKEDK